MPPHTGPGGTAGPALTITDAIPAAALRRAAVTLAPARTRPAVTLAARRRPAVTQAAARSRPAGHLPRTETGPLAAVVGRWPGGTHSRPDTRLFGSSFCRANGVRLLRGRTPREVQERS
ncbi:hypothetical protein GCM10009635_06140 [Actinocatenispora thailandica]